MRSLLFAVVLVGLCLGLPSTAQEAEGSEYWLLYTVQHGFTAEGAPLRDLFVTDLKGNESLIAEHLLSVASLSPNQDKVAVRSFNGDLLILDRQGDIIARHVFSTSLPDSTFDRWFGDSVCCSPDAYRSFEDSFWREDRRWNVRGWRDENVLVASEVTQAGLTFYEIDISSSPPQLYERTHLNRFFDRQLGFGIDAASYPGCRCSLVIVSPDIRYAIVPLHFLEPTKSVFLEDAMVWDVQQARSIALIQLLPWWWGAPPPVWSPIGDRIAFNAWNDNERGVYVYDLETSPELVMETICRTSCEARTLTWSPHENYVASWLPGGLAITDLETNDTLEVAAQPYHFTIAWTIDERYIAFLQGKGEVRINEAEIRVVDVSTGNVIFSHIVPSHAQVVGWIAS